jgi:hypothetical protein
VYCPSAARTRLLVCALLALASSDTSAQAPPGEQEPLVNFVFASQLGSGVYAGGDSVVQVYRIPYNHTLRKLEGNPFGVQLRFTLTPGFYNFEARDILNGVLPSNVSTVTVTAGAAFPVRLGKRWSTAPLGEVGYGHDFTRGIGSPLYTIGLLTDGTLERDRWTLLVHNRFIWTRQTRNTAGFLDELLRLQTALDARRPLPFRLGKREVDIGMFAASYVYFDTIDFLRFPQPLPFSVAQRGSMLDETIAELERDGVTSQWELGVSFGMTPNLVWKIPVPRIGVSYRFGTDTTAWRLVLGGVF